MNIYQNITIVIPTLDPSETLILYINSLISNGFKSIIVVNDGSGSEYDKIFDKIHAIEECTLLTHDKNKGKGSALKTAYSFILENHSQTEGIITADSDGQHAVSDVCKIADELLKNPDRLILGERNFTRKDIPLKSRLGNNISTIIFYLFYRKWLKDTQTGLRGFGITLLSEMFSVSGERFEYEMAVLTNCISKKIIIDSITIDTIYIDGNSSSHFRPVLDSISIGSVLTTRFTKFMASSGICCLIDIALCWTLLYVLGSFISSDILRIGTSVTLARIVSMIANYSFNRSYVFKVKSHLIKSFAKYISLASINMIVATLIIYVGHHYLQIDERVAKLIADTILFVINYQVQHRLIFNNNSREKNDK